MRMRLGKVLNPTFAISVMALAVALGGGAAWAAAGTAPRATVTCVTITHFQNHWKNAPSSDGFRKTQACRDSLGFVHLYGLLTGGTAQTTAFTLPHGFRAKFNHAWAVAAGLGAPTMPEDVDVFNNGAVFLNGSLDPVSLDGVSFHVGG